MINEMDIVEIPFFSKHFLRERGVGIIIDLILSSGSPQSVKKISIG
jgi:hypothetical protein